MHDWTRKAGPIENLSLWLELVDAARPHKLQWDWVRGHAGHPQNEYANDLAVAAAKEQTNSDGARSAEFDSWREVQRAKKRVKLDPAPFPRAENFVAARRLPSTTSVIQ